MRNARYGTIVVVMAAILMVLAAHCGIAESPSRTCGSEYPYMCSGALRYAELSDLPEGVVARCEGITVNRGDLDAQIEKLAGQSQQQARKYPVYALEQYLAKHIALIEAKDWAITNGHTEGSDEELVRNYMAAQIPEFEVSEKEAEDFYKEHVSMFGGSTYDQIKDAVAYFVQDQKTSEAEDEFIGLAGKRHTILVSASWIRTEHERWAKNPVERARASGRPTYVNFGVIGCCDKMNPVTQALRADYGDRLNVVFVHTGQEEVLSDIYGVSTIPVQLLFDKGGKQIMRHQGNISEAQVLDKFAEGGVDLSKGGTDE